MKLQIKKQITIEASAAAIYDRLVDFSKWSVWSPWTHIEPQAKIEVTGAPAQAGHRQTWNGEVTGTGQMTLEQLEKNQKVNIDLQFLTPWKSSAKVVFSLSEIKSGTTSVTWAMDSSLPIFMFFFKNMMAAYIGADFERGLKNLKDYAETGAVPSRSEFLDIHPQEAFQVVGRRATCAIPEISVVMRREYEKVGRDMQSGALSKSARMGALHHKFDIPKGICEFTAGIFYGESEKVLVPAGYELIKVPAHKSLRVDHYGAYRHLANPWSMVSAYLRGRKLKSRKDIAMYDVYVTMPDGRPENEIYTQLFAPVK